MTIIYWSFGIFRVVGLIYRPTGISQELSVSIIKVADSSGTSAHIYTTKHNDLPENGYLRSQHQRNHRSKETICKIFVPFGKNVYVER